jgi:hypothetical protein
MEHRTCYRKVQRRYSRSRRWYSTRNDQIGVESNAPRDPKQLAEEWGLKIQQDKKAAEQGERALAEIMIPYFNIVQEYSTSEFASEACLAFHS